MENFVVISGCSSGGKSTLLAELARRGHAVVEEPGRRIVAAELASNGNALPWVDPEAFIRRAIAMALADRDGKSGPGLVFFDRGLVDAASALTEMTGELWLSTLGEAHRYHGRVFMVPPWAEIYVTDPERRHGLAEAIVEYERLQRDYVALGYELVVIPKTPVSERADFVLGTLGVKKLL